MTKLKDLLKEAPKKGEYPKKLTGLIDTLISSMGYKKYQLSVNNLHGKYVIELPTTGFSVPQLKKLGSVLDSDMGVSYSPYTSFSGMIIRTQIPI